MNTPPSRRSAFTLVELLIVIGIIAVLISMLLPVLSKVREQSRQVVCMNNLHQIGSAMIAYSADYDGYLPATARNATDSKGIFAPNYPSNDWLFWQSNRVTSYPNGDEINHSALGKYLALNPASLGVLRCPSDDPAGRPKQIGQIAGPFSFSYVMNWLIASDSSLIAGSAPPYTGTPPALCVSLHKVLNPSQKVLVYEEDPVSNDDGEGMAWAGATAFSPNTDPSTWGTIGRVNLLSLRHEPSKAPADPKTADSVQGPWASAVPSPDAHGNVAFCDGHAEFVMRSFVHRPDHTIGTQY